jgi:hypothetical protein
MLMQLLMLKMILLLLQLSMQNDRLSEELDADLLLRLRHDWLARSARGGRRSRCRGWQWRRR